MLLWQLSVCQVSLDKNHIGLGGTGGIHRAILMNCAAQAALNAASEAAFSLPIRCGFYQAAVRRTLCSEKGAWKFPAVAGDTARTGWAHPKGRGAFRKSAGAADGIWSIGYSYVQPV